VRLPTDDDHLIVGAYRQTLACAAAEVKRLNAEWSRRAHAMLNHRLRWAGLRQDRGVFYVPDLIESDIDPERLAEILRSCEACSTTEPS
jgi:hypothetical protein